ncbi:hypothetical protein Goshw_021513 [Gossypium schwendimanii]|uniref:Uncharacterized protein n=1 Tax=Gossypium schwendimanii TaxID=34291 RepID=A0A7J9NDL2_GOSSC|nr:hypothetical protein [Gossypium schwendimanii]
MEEEYWHMILELDTPRMIEIKNSFNY